VECATQRQHSQWTLLHWSYWSQGKLFWFLEMFIQVRSWSEGFLSNLSSTVDDNSILPSQAFVNSHPINMKTFGGFCILCMCGASLISFSQELLWNCGQWCCCCLLFLLVFL
jgi:hypothetical protein